METIRQRQPTGTTGPSIRDELDQIRQEIRYGRQKKESVEEKKEWKFPYKFKSMMNKAKNKKDKILVFFLNIRGEVEKPLLLPIYSGNMVIIRNKPYEVDPRAFWQLGKNKLLIIKEIDRRPVSNLDLDEIRKRGDATDSDEFLIKAAMRAVQQAGTKQVNKGVIIIVVIAIVALLAYLLFIKK